MTLTASRVLPSQRLKRSFQREILRWYRSHGRVFPWRKPSSTTYMKIVAEVLLKRTRAETVAKFFGPFIRQFPSWVKLSAATENQLQQFLQPIGLWRQRAASLTSLAAHIAARNGRLPRDRAEIDQLAGVGQYVANAIVLFCQNGREPLLDSGMSRLVERCFGARTLVDIRYDPWLQNLAKHLVDHANPVELNWAMLDLAALVCRPKAPLCDECPVNAFCEFRRATRGNER